MPVKYKFRLCLLVHNRPFFAKQALESLLNQNYNDYEVYVSDNSDDDSFIVSLNNLYSNFSNLKFIYRDIQLKAIEHINKVLDESMTFDFVMLFHDDDLLHHDYLKTISEITQLEDNNLAGIAINGRVITKNGFSKKNITQYNKNIEITSKESIVEKYFSFDSKGAAPFPGYLYNIRNIKNKRLNFNHGGKHSDVTFLIELLDTGYFLWIDKVLMDYRILEKNDSKYMSEIDRSNLKKYLVNNKLLTKRVALDYELMLEKERYFNKRISLIDLTKYILKYIYHNTLDNFRIIKILFIKLI